MKTQEQVITEAINQIMDWRKDETVFKSDLIRILFPVYKAGHEEGMENMQATYRKINGIS